MRVRLEVETDSGRIIGASVPVASFLPSYRDPSVHELEMQRNILRGAMRQIQADIERELYG
ncbi:hypothetical protein SSEA_SKINNY_131 [Mycobacterium phage Skinny]|uniref:Uncharacterized protein n=5 Tax=Bongovirus bongo TaxID=1983750 RepID=A0A0M5M6K4_9CAUD|nr:hypothetical protein PEGLEG_128 [Mycobacterium phage PegLeg]YP_009604961.1 hypothetical protein FDH95_gp120 [Mycobacterium phage Bongo]ALF00633.1 hypothetical protein SEA_BRICOLE_127 [Mycobacterium phage Bricole]AXQ52745.1 hypothetical protein SEA_IPHANE7_123 [Mycobacterium phage IPhane7]QDH93681.1 hypothetical protein SEA_LILHOMIEP_125 [Mycobacterium phage LilhomieP]UXE05303.1 hypothetical protein SSEA_SKINNY_131 [Mycobacterium phage Skinny]WMI33285.1 hypothetical protein SEA_SLIMJIMMY_12